MTRSRFDKLVLLYQLCMNRPNKLMMTINWKQPKVFQFSPVGLCKLKISYDRKTIKQVICRTLCTFSQSRNCSGMRDTKQIKLFLNATRCPAIILTIQHGLEEHLKGIGLVDLKFKAINIIGCYLISCPTEVELIGTDMIFKRLHWTFTDREFVIQFQRNAPSTLFRL